MFAWLTEPGIFYGQVKIAVSKAIVLHVQVRSIV